MGEKKKTLKRLVVNLNKINWFIGDMRWLCVMQTVNGDFEDTIKTQAGVCAQWMRITV